MSRSLNAESSFGQSQRQTNWMVIERRFRVAQMRYSFCLWCFSLCCCHSLKMIARSAERQNWTLTTTVHQAKEKAHTITFSSSIPTTVAPWAALKFVQIGLFFGFFFFCTLAHIFSIGIFFQPTEERKTHTQTRIHAHNQCHWTKSSSFSWLIEGQRKRLKFMETPQMCRTNTLHFNRPKG